VLEGAGAPRWRKRLGRARIAVDAVFDSVSVATTFQKELKQAGVIFMPISEAIREHPELVKKYLGTVVPTSDNYFRHAELGGVFRRLVRLRAAGRALSDGAVDLLPHQRAQHRQFERTLIIADKGAYVSYLEGCTAPQRDEKPVACRRGRTGHA